MERYSVLNFFVFELYGCFFFIYSIYYQSMLRNSTLVICIGADLALKCV